MSWIPFQVPAEKIIPSTLEAGAYEHNALYLNLFTAETDLRFEKAG